MRQDGLVAAVAAQVGRVRSTPSDSSALIERAAAVVPRLVAQLGLDQFVGPFREDGKPRLLLRFSHATAGNFPADVILKVYGDCPRGEGSLLADWAQRHISTPRLIYGEMSGCSWILLEYLAMRPVDLSSQEACLRLTDRLASIFREAHRTEENAVTTLRPLGQVMTPRWAQSATVLRRLGFSIPDHWDRLAGALYSMAPTRPLHGDLAEANIGMVNDRIVIFDASALTGPQAFDGARWAARLARHAVDPLEAFSRWATHEGLDHDRMTAELLAVECVLEAGAIPGGGSTAEPYVSVSERLIQSAAKILT